MLLFLAGMLSCSDTQTVTYRLPKQGHYAVDFLSDHPGFWRLYEQDLYYYDAGKTAKHLHRFQANQGVQWHNLHAVGADLYYFNSLEVTALGNKETYKLSYPEVSLIKSRSDASIAYNRRLLSRVGYPHENTRTQDAFIAYGNKALLAVFDTHNQFTTQFLTVPIIPHAENKGINYGSLASYVCQNDSILLVSYAQYGWVYRVDLSSLQIIDSIYFPDLSANERLHFPLEAQNPQTKLQLYKKQPQFSKALIDGDWIIRFLIRPDHISLIAYNTRNGRFKRKKLPQNFEYASLLSHHGQLYQTSGYDSVDYYLGNVRTLHWPELLP
jgi:hypothetical protein